MHCACERMQPSPTTYISTIAVKDDCAWRAWRPTWGGSKRRPQYNYYEGQKYEYEWQPVAHQVH